VKFQPVAPPPPSAPSLPDGLRWYLHLTVVVTGAAILVLEILGARMLTPFFGSSHFVWSAQIAVTMLSLAVGYALGGRIADRRNAVTSLYGLILLSAFYLVATVMFRIPLATACLAMDLALGSTLASFGLFFVPLSLLATAGPLVIRALTTSLGSVGTQVGRLTALGTVGSLGGVVLSSYVLIPYVRDSLALLLTAAALGMVVLGYGFFARRLKASAQLGVLALLFVSVLLGGRALRVDQIPVWPGHTEIARTNSHFGLMQVIESNDHRRRFYLNDFLIQNSYDVTSRKSISIFTELLVGLSEAYTPTLRKALCLGMGVGIVPMRLASTGTTVDVVEINPAVVPLAQAYFHFDPSRVGLVIDDARHFLSNTRARYDTVHLDAFVGDSMPSHLMTREAFTTIRGCLEPGGTLVINSFVSFEPGRDFLGTSLYRTLKDVFADVVIHASEGGNVFYVASDRTPLVPVRSPNFSGTHASRYSQAVACYANRVVPKMDGGMVLTDDYNPADFRDATNREELRRRLANYAVGK